MSDVLKIKMNEYLEHFGEPYVFVFGFPKDIKDVVREIETCIKENKKQVIPEYDENLDY